MDEKNIICAGCKKEFIPGIRPKIYCSRNCSKKVLRLYKKSQGICVDCLSKAEVGKVRCSFCLKRITNYYHFSMDRSHKLELDSKYRTKLKQDVINNYGGKCNCCDENKIEFLTIDHINNDGKLKRLVHGRTTQFYAKLRKDGYPKVEYQLLCYNCNIGKSIRGVCPHKESLFPELIKHYPKYYNKYRFNIKREVIDHYGGKCVCCGESTIHFLAMDHINGEGNKHRREEITSGPVFVWIKRMKYPKNIFQILCHNCNAAKEYIDVCPHKQLS